MEYPSKNHYTEYKRYCKTLSLEDDPQLIEDYKKVHRKGAVWPEVTQGMTDVGILDMEIYIHGTQLFMIMDTRPDFEHDKAMARLARHLTLSVHCRGTSTSKPSPLCHCVTSMKWCSSAKGS